MSVSLTDRLQALASERLERLRSVAVQDLLKIPDDFEHLRGRWLFRGRVWTEVVELPGGILRVAVFQEGWAPWWPSYLHEVDGFRIGPDGVRGELTTQDRYDLG